MRCRGAVAGHFAGRHTMSGPAIGCGVEAVKRHRGTRRRAGAGSSEGATVTEPTTAQATSMAPRACKEGVNE